MNHVKKISYVAMILGMFSTAVFADVTAANTLATQSLNQQNLVTNKLNQQELLAKSQEWGLTEQEWQRYQELNQGARGIWSPGLDPLTSLGVESRNRAGKRALCSTTGKKNARPHGARAAVPTHL